MADVDQARFEIGANDLIVPWIERTEDIDLRPFKLFKIEPVANLAIALASADVDLGRVDHIGGQKVRPQALDINRSSSENGAARTCKIDPNESISRKPEGSPSKRTVRVTSVNLG